mmetsp:Transcript_68474/g.164434  ORF Transcript_68474/g.164434 Transcript_68474/m.164434 type:complete len:240 (+) Transcript_68474:112-831(+)
MDIDEVASRAEKALRDFQGMVQGSSKAKGSTDEDERLYQAWEKAAQKAQHALDSYRVELRSLPKTEQDAHKQRLKKLEDGLRTGRGELNWKRTQARNQAAQSLLEAQAPQGGIDEEAGLTLEQVRAEAEGIQDASKQSLARTMKTALEAERVGIATLEKMHAQEEQLDGIKEELEDVRANLKRSKKLLSQIARNAAGDRCVQLLCLGLVAAVIICMILAATGMDGGKLNAPSADEIRGN